MAMGSSHVLQSTCDSARTAECFGHCAHTVPLHVILRHRANNHAACGKQGLCVEGKAGGDGRESMLLGMI